MILYPIFFIKDTLKSRKKKYAIGKKRIAVKIAVKIHPNTVISVVMEGPTIITHMKISAKPNKIKSSLKFSLKTILRAL